MKKFIPLKTAKKILNDAVSNTYVGLEYLTYLSDSLKKLTLTYSYGEGNDDEIYKLIYSSKDQEAMIDFLYEVYYHILAYGYDIDYLRKLRSSTSDFLTNSKLSEPIKGMSNTDSDEVDILFSITVFLRLFLNQFDTELIKRNNSIQKQNRN